MVLRSPLLALAALVLLLVGTAPRAGVLEFSDDHVRADLLADRDALVAGSTAQLALRLRHAPHWHTYWINPGDAGLPTTMRWSLPAGWKAEDLRWPLPRKLPVGALANYGYEGEVLLPVSVRVPADARPGSSVHLQAHASWLVCSDVCIPGGADLALDLPVRAAGSAPQDSADSGAIRRALAAVPAPMSLAAARARAEGTRVRLDFDLPGNAPRALEFFPLRTGWIVPAASQVLHIQGRHASLDLTAVEALPADMKAIEGVLAADGGPPPEGSGWSGAVSIPLARSALPAAVAPATPGGTTTAAGAAPASAPVSAAPAAISSTPTGPASSLPVPAAEFGFASFLIAVGGAFLGGLILNLMPCVFPVLSLKVLALAGQHGVSRPRMLAQGGAYAAGVIASFLLLALVLLGLRGAGAQVGWGFQLQSPGVVAALVALFFLIGLNLIGAFEFTLGQGLANADGGRSVPGEGLGGSFATGVLAAVVASPCSAPFMGAALGFAASQPSAAALSIFAALGAGVAAPYVLLSAVPSWQRHLPRPGVWMERLRQIMAFPMFLTCVWLFWVLSQQVDIDATAWMLGALVALGMAAWGLGLFQRGARAFGWVAAAAAVAGLAALFPVQSGGPAAVAAPPAASASATPGSTWSAWSPETQRAALASGKPVLVDFTAAWCISCKANERYALADGRVRDALARRGVTLLRGDWTRRDESISLELARFGRTGVPLYVLYDGRGGSKVLPELLTPGVVLEAIGTI